MSRLSAVLMTAGVCLVALGCAAPERSGAPEPVGAIVDQSPRLNSPAMLFDRHGAGVPYGRYAYRSDWPSAAGYYDTGEVVYYREWTWDYQGQGPFGTDYHRRALRIYRAGVAYR